MGGMQKLRRRLRFSLAHAGDSPFDFVVAPLIIFLLLGTTQYTIPFLVDTYESVSFGLFPSAQKAYEYGELHFNASYPQYYDVDLAKYYYYKAAALDPHLPYVWHEIARTSFIQGDFIRALAQIDIQIAQEGDGTANSFYVRGLIEAFMGDYPDAEKDYAHYYSLVPYTWPGANDYAWVLLKDNKPQEAVNILEPILVYYPNNPWLLNSDAIALYETGNTALARERIEAASRAAADLTPDDWSRAYPGNDPNIAQQGLDQFKAAVESNIHTIDNRANIDAL